MPTPEQRAEFDRLWADATPLTIADLASPEAFDAWLTRAIAAQDELDEP